MNTLAQEAYRMQNPALGAVLLWRFAKGHVAADVQKRGASLPLAFLVLPMVWHLDMADTISGTRDDSGLRKFAAKFTETDAARDILLGIHPRAVRWRPRTQAAIRMGLSAGLLDVRDGRLAPLRSGNEPRSNRTVTAMGDAAERLGIWFSALSLHEVGIILHIQF